MYKYLAQVWRAFSKSYVKDLVRERAIKWRRGRAVVRINKPTRLNKARALGYKAKSGIVVVRVRVRRGGMRKPRPSSGRRQKRMGVKKHVPAVSIKKIAEGRALRKFPNLKLLGSYWIFSDGRFNWYEVLMADPRHPAIISDPDLSWLRE